MKNSHRPGNRLLAFWLAIFAATLSTHGAIESKFDDGVYPGGPGNGWVAGWTNNVGTPVFWTNNPLPSLDGASPYLHLDATGNTIRNFMRQCTNGAGVNLSMPHIIHWKFRLDETDFEANFSSNNDRVHFFGRNGSRVTASSDASVNWMIYGAGGPVNGVATGRTFWLCDNANKSGNFDTTTGVDTLVPIVPFHTYAFEVQVIPDQQQFTVSIVDESTNNVSFKSSAPHTVRNLTAAPDSFTFLHFGTQASASTKSRPFDLDSVTITQAVAPWTGPSIQNLTPGSYAVCGAANGIHFTATAPVPIETNAISLILNSTDVSRQLTFTGNPTNRTVAFYGLAANLKYKMVITVTNTGGSVSVTNVCYTPEQPLTLFDSDGFTSDTLYPVGLLPAVTNADCYWAPAAAPNSAEIADLADGVHGKVLRRQQLGNDQIDYLIFPPVASGTVIIDLDARVSSMDGRTIDLSLNSVTPAGGGTQGPFIMWGTNALNYYDRTAWVPQASLDANWHHIQLTSYVSGALAGLFDLAVDHVPASKSLVWRNVFSPVGTLRIGAIRGAVIEYGEVDNLVVKVAPEFQVAPLQLLHPLRSGSTFAFSFPSAANLNYVAQYNSDLGTTNWTTLATLPGDGTVKMVTHTNAPAGASFYRVKTEKP
jgi:hypothetical protein